MPEKQKGVKRRKKTNQNSTKQRTNHLLIIGIDQYSNSIPILNNAVRDAENFRDLLLEKYQFSEENLTYLFNEEATRANILDTFSALLDELTDEDNLIFYYSGHGEQIKRGKGTRGYWIPSDAKLGKTSSYIPNADINALFKDALAHHVFGIVDSCYSGSLFKQRNSSNADERIRSFPSRWLLTAGRLEPVSDGSLGANSPFAEALLTYLKHNPDNSLWVSDLCNRVIKGMDFNTKKQTPRGEPLHGVGNYSGQFVFFKKGVVPPKETITKKEDSSEQGQSKGLDKETPSTVVNEPPIKLPTNLAELKSYLKKLIYKDLGKTIETFQSYLTPDSSIENDLILQMGRFNSNKKQSNNFLITSDQANRTNNQIRHAILSYIDDLEAEDVQFQPAITNNEITFSTSDLAKLEQAGLKSQAELLIKKLNYLRNDLIIQTDASRKFQLNHEIEQLEAQLAAIKLKI